MPDPCHRGTYLHHRYVAANVIGHINFLFVISSRSSVSALFTPFSFIFVPRISSTTVRLSFDRASAVSPSPLSVSAVDIPVYKVENAAYELFSRKNTIMHFALGVFPFKFRNPRSNSIAILRPPECERQIKPYNLTHRAGPIDDDSCLILKSRESGLHLLLLCVAFACLLAWLVCAVCLVHAGCLT